MTTKDYRYCGSFHCLYSLAVPKGVDVVTVSLRVTDELSALGRLLRYLSIHSCPETVFVAPLSSTPEFYDSATRPWRHSTS